MKSVFEPREGGRAPRRLIEPLRRSLKSIWPSARSLLDVPDQPIGNSGAWSKIKNICIYLCTISRDKESFNLSWGCRRAIILPRVPWCFALLLCVNIFFNVFFSFFDLYIYRYLCCCIIARSILQLTFYPFAQCILHYTLVPIYLSHCCRDKGRKTSTIYTPVQPPANSSTPRLSSALYETLAHTPSFALVILFSPTDLPLAVVRLKFLSWLSGRWTLYMRFRSVYIQDKTGAGVAFATVRIIKKIHFRNVKGLFVSTLQWISKRKTTKPKIWCIRTKNIPPNGSRRNELYYRQWNKKLLLIRKCTQSRWIRVDENRFFFKSKIHKN